MKKLRKLSAFICGTFLGISLGGILTSLLLQNKLYLFMIVFALIIPPINIIFFLMPIILGAMFIELIDSTQHSLMIPSCVVGAIFGGVLGVIGCGLTDGDLAMLFMGPTCGILSAFFTVKFYTKNT